MQEVAHRPLVVYKYNMLAHIGAVSSFEVRPDRAKWPACYHSMALVRSPAPLRRVTRPSTLGCGHTATLYCAPRG